MPERIYVELEGQVEAFFYHERADMIEWEGDGLLMFFSTGLNCNMTYVFEQNDHERMGKYVQVVASTDKTKLIVHEVFDENDYRTTSSTNPTRFEDIVSEAVYNVFEKGR